jgi:hypothetical protein
LSSLNGLLDERPGFFVFLTGALWAGGHIVAVLTCRDPDSRARTEAQLECIRDVGEPTTVFKFRNGGNFDFNQRRWLRTARLTRLL